MKKSRKKRSVIWKLGTDELKRVVNESKCFSDVLRYFGLENKGGNYRTLRERLKYDGIEYRRFSNYGKPPLNVLKSLEEIMVEKSQYSRGSLKARIIKDKIIPYVCAECGHQPLWRGKSLVLILDHINGVYNDHRKENLRFLCPMCNSQSETFAGRRKAYKDEIKCVKCEVNDANKSSPYCSECKLGKCPKCNAETKKDGRMCKKCSGEMRRKVVRPSKEDLQKMLWEIPTAKIGRQFGVSDKSVAKWAKKYKLNKPSRGYWAKQRSQN